MINATATPGAQANAAIAAAAQSSSGPTGAGAAGSEDRFLKLLVAQLSNQDPMNPMDNAQMTSQMAQISTVSGVQQVNATLKSLANQFSSMQMLQGGSLIGRNVLVQGNQLAPSGGVAHGAVDLASNADKVKIEVLSASGSVIDTIELGAQAAGRHPFDWDASAHAGVVKPSYRVTATLGGSAVTATPLVRDKVVAISSDNGVMNMQLEGSGIVAYSAVKSIL